MEMAVFKIFGKNQWSLAAFIVFILFLTQLPACLARGEYEKTPVSKKVDISQPNVKTELLVHISLEDNYVFSLDFKCKNKEDRVRVSTLLWGKDAYGRETNGEKTPISIDVYTQKDGETHLVSIGGGESMKTYAMSGGYGKLIYTDYLMPGYYRVAIDTKAGNPKFKDVEVELNIHRAYRPK